MEINASIKITSIHKDVRSFLQTMVGKQVSLFVKDVDATQTKTQLQIGSKLFEATINGPKLKIGQQIKVSVQKAPQGGLQLVVLPSNFIELSLLNVNQNLLSKDLVNMLSIFFWGNKKEHIARGLESTKNDKTIKKGKWVHTFRKGLKLNDVLSQGLDALLENLLQEDEGESRIDRAYQEEFLVESDFIKGKAEQWKFHCFGNTQMSPYYYFFYANTGLSGAISGSILALEADFSKVSLLLRFESPLMNTYFDKYKHFFLKSLRDEGIEIQELSFLSHKESHGLDLQI